MIEIYKLMLAIEKKVDDIFIKFCWIPEHSKTDVASGRSIQLVRKVWFS